MALPIDDLRVALGAGDRAGALAALAVLARQPDARAVEPLIVALGAEPPEIREAAARTLGAIGAALGGARIAAALTAALNDADWGTRQSAAEMLLQLDAEAAPAAERLLLDDLADADAEIRLGAACSLAVLGDARALDPLVGLLAHGSDQVAESAAYGLGTLADPQAGAPLTAALEHPALSVRQAAAWALRQLEHEAR